MRVPQRHMLRFLRSIWIWTASATLIVLWVPLLGVIWTFDRGANRLRTGRWFRRLGRLLGKLNPWRIHISGLENMDPDQVYVVVSNHQSLADIPLISHLKLDAKWLAKAELFRIPLLGWMLRMAGDIPVERSVPRQSARAMLTCAKYLRQHCSVVFFPEGGRSLDGEIQQFNDGAFRLALREHVPILPLVVHGTANALPRKTWLFGQNQDVWLRVLKPVPVEGWTSYQSAELRDSVRQSIVEGLHRLRDLDQTPKNH